MAKYLVEGGYECDRQSKYDFTASTVNYLCEVYGEKVKSIIFKEFDVHGNQVEFDSIYSDSESRSDLVMYYNNIPYLIELKERWGGYHSNWCGKEGDEEGWFLNIPKKEQLLNQNWAIPLYVNLYPDNVVRLWNLRQINDYPEHNHTIGIKTVEDKGRKMQKRNGLWNKDSKVIQRIKGQPSNGVFIASSSNHS
ncbi:MAG: hypothetical protein UHM08_04410 [Bacteroidales bacterium]|nr:hypothetical protein [Bacteroidales bacterium]